MLLLSKVYFESVYYKRTIHDEVNVQRFAMHFRAILNMVCCLEVLLQNFGCLGWNVSCIGDCIGCNFNLEDSTKPPEAPLDLSQRSFLLLRNLRANVTWLQQPEFLCFCHGDWVVLFENTVQFQKLKNGKMNSECTQIMTLYWLFWCVVQRHLASKIAMFQHFTLFGMIQLL